MVCDGIQQLTNSSRSCAHLTFSGLSDEQSSTAFTVSAGPLLGFLFTSTSLGQSSLIWVPVLILYYWEVLKLPSSSNSNTFNMGDSKGVSTRFKQAFHCSAFVLSIQEIVMVWNWTRPWGDTELWLSLPPPPPSWDRSFVLSELNKNGWCGDK